MFTNIFYLGNIAFVLFYSWLIFRYLAKQEVNYIQAYKRISLLFFISAAILFVLNFYILKRLFFSFSPLPFLALLLFYCIFFLIYRQMRFYRDIDLIERLEAKKVFLASMSYRYIIYKSFDILFQQMAILCVLIFLKELNIPYILLVILFAISFSVSHLFMLKRGALIGLIFLAAALIGGIIFPMVLILQYGIVYSYILHWLFYIFLGVLLHFSYRQRKHKDRIKEAN